MRQGWGQDDPVFRQMFTSLFIPGANRLQMDWFNELQRRTLTPDNALRLTFAFADIDISRTLRAAARPALVLHASGDRVAPFSEGLEVARKITGARFVELDSANHILLADEPAFREFHRRDIGICKRGAAGANRGSVDQRTRRQATILSADFVTRCRAMEDAAPRDRAGTGRSLARAGCRNGARTTAGRC